MTREQELMDMHDDTRPNVSRESTNPKDAIGRTKVPILSAVPPTSIIYEALGFADGVVKYGAYNWRDKEVSAMVYIDACLRHIMDWVDGEDDAKDSTAPHIGHAKACLGIIADAKENGCLVDDRPKPGVTSELLERYKATIKYLQDQAKAKFEANAKKMSDEGHWEGGPLGLTWIPHVKKEWTDKELYDYAAMAEHAIVDQNQPGVPGHE